MKKIIAKVTDYPFIEKGKTYYMDKSDFCGGCYHIYAADYRDSHIFNIFSREEFESLFDER